MKNIFFRPVPPPYKEDMNRLLVQIARATEKLIKQREEDAEMDEEEPDLLTQEQAQSLKFHATPAGNVVSESERCAFLQGYSLHAERVIDSDDRDGLERLCRYGARSPIANNRLSLDEQGNVIFKLKRRYFDGRTQLKFTPVQFLQKLALLIPPPWKNLTRYHGVFAPNHAHRADIINIGRPKSDKDEESKDATALKPPRSLPWAMLLRRVFAIDVLKCDSCGGTMEIVAIVSAVDAEEALKQALAQPSDVQPRATSPPSATKMI